MVRWGILWDDVNFYVPTVRQRCCCERTSKETENKDRACIRGERTSHLERGIHHEANDEHGLTSELLG